MHTGSVNPLDAIIAQFGLVILDGGLATELERRGHDLQDDLWSAKVLLESPHEIRCVHESFYRHGADVATTATYQASFEGLARKGLDRTQSRALFAKALDLACEARAELVEHTALTGRPVPLVAGSLGSYGAFLADGSEYRGRYGVPSSTLRKFHQPRLGALTELFQRGKLDVIAVETCPSLVEAQVVAELLETSPVGAWVSFSLQDAHHIADGVPLEKAVEAVSSNPRVLAVGVNCVSPLLVSGAVDHVRAVTQKPIVVYPNSGEAYDPHSRTWYWRSHPPRHWVTFVPEWYEKGARLIGGCCRTTPEDIQKLADWRRSGFPA